MRALITFLRNRKASDLCHYFWKGPFAVGKKDCLDLFHSSILRGSLLKIKSCSGRAFTRFAKHDGLRSHFSNGLTENIFALSQRVTNRNRTKKTQVNLTSLSTGAGHKWRGPMASTGASPKKGLVQKDLLFDIIYLLEQAQRAVKTVSSKMNLLSNLILKTSNYWASSS